VHPGSLTVSEGVDYQRAITGRRYKLIYNAQPNQPYSPVDQGGRFLDPAQDTSEIGKHEILPAIARADAERALGAWKDIVEAHQAGKLAPLHERLYFQRPRPIFELYDLQDDPDELNNLAGKPNYQAIEITLREKLDTWMVLSTIICPWRQMPIAKPPIRNADRESNETAMPFSGFAPGQAWQKLNQEIHTFHFRLTYSSLQKIKTKVSACNADRIAHVPSLAPHALSGNSDGADVCLAHGTCRMARYKPHPHRYRTKGREARPLDKGRGGQRYRVCHG
jgi:hypothetical protein